MKNLLSPVDLTKAQNVYIYKLTEVIIVIKNKNFVFAAFWVVFLYLQCFYNSLKLTIISFVASFDQNHFWKKINY